MIITDKSALAEAFERWLAHYEESPETFEEEYQGDGTYGENCAAYLSDLLITGPGVKEDLPVALTIVVRWLWPHVVTTVPGHLAEDILAELREAGLLRG